jgi:hypothetical protein
MNADEASVKASAGLLGCFAAAMTFSLGIKAPLNYSQPLSMRLPASCSRRGRTGQRGTGTRPITRGGHENGVKHTLWVYRRKLKPTIRRNAT